MKKTLFFSMLVISLSFLGFIGAAKADTPPAYTPVIKVNEGDSTKSDIYLQNPNTIQQKYFMTLTGVAREQYQAAEYHNGNLYIIKKADDHGYELWRYNSKQEGTKLYSGDSIDFRVAPDERLLVIINNTADVTNNVIIMRKDGTIIKKINKANSLLKSTDLPKEYQGRTMSLNFISNSFKLDWDTRYVWLYNVSGSKHLGLIKIDTKSATIKKYNLTKLKIGSEVAFNIFKEKLAYSNYPYIFDIAGQKAYKQAKTADTLFVYDLNQKTNKVIGTLPGIPFNPKWTDKHTLEYNTSDSNRKTRTVVW